MYNDHLVAPAQHPQPPTYIWVQMSQPREHITPRSTVTRIVYPHRASTPPLPELPPPPHSSTIHRSHAASQRTHRALCIAPPRHVCASTVVYGASRVVHVAAAADRVAAQLGVACCAQVASQLLGCSRRGSCARPTISRVCVQCSQLRAAGSTPPVCSTVDAARNGERRSHAQCSHHWLHYDRTPAQPIALPTPSQHTETAERQRRRAGRGSLESHERVWLLRSIAYTTNACGVRCGLAEEAWEAGEAGEEGERFMRAAARCRGGPHPDASRSPWSGDALACASSAHVNPRRSVLRQWVPYRGYIGLYRVI
jgi:hypothetical protein